MQTDIYIPKALSAYVLTERVHQEFRLFIYLKMSCSGKVCIDKDYVEKACTTLKIGRSTFYRQLQRLKRMQWVHKSSRSGLYFIKGFARLLEKENLKGKTATYFVSEWFDRFQAFLSGSVIGYLCKHRRKAERKKGRSNKLSPVATSALASILSLPQSTAYQLKKKASQYNFITKVRWLKETGVLSCYRKQVSKAYPESAHRLINRCGMLYWSMPDLCCEELKYKTKRY